MTQNTEGSPKVSPSSLRPGITERIDALRGSDCDRKLAAEYLHYGELIADLICRARAKLRFALAFLGKALVPRQKGPRPE